MRLCQDAGYHCLTSDDADAGAQNKLITFWIAFSMDSGLSLNFGKSPSLHDYDITASRPLFIEDRSNLVVLLCFVSAELAYLQGDVYKQLYSGQAQLETRSSKAQLAQALAVRTMSLRGELLSVSISPPKWYRHRI